MRSLAMENLLVRMEDTIETYEHMLPEECVKNFINLRVTSRIIRDRSDRSQSVVRELLNEG